MTMRTQKHAQTLGAGAIIFDLDGTLVDSVSDMTAEINKILVERGLEPLLVKTTSKFLGDGMRSFARRAFSVRGMIDLEESLNTFVARYRDSAHSLTTPYEGVKETLSALRERGWRISVCTNKDESIATAILQETDLLKYMDVVCGGDTVSFQKPDPRHLRAVVARAEYSKLHKIMIGDNKNDFEAAHGYEMSFAFAHWGYGSLVDDNKAVILRRFIDILDFVDLPS